MQSGKVLSLLAHSAENARVCLCVFQCDKNVEKHLKEVEWLESCGQDVCQISCCVFLVLSSSAQGPLMLRLYVFACVKENCICVTHEMATIYLFMHFKCVFSPPRVVSSLLASVLCVCVQPTTTVPAHMTLLSGVWKAPKLCSTLTHQVFFGLYSSSSSDPMQTWTHFHICTLSHSPAKAIVLPRTIMSWFE